MIPMQTACTLSPLVRNRGGSRNVEGGVLIVHAQGRRKQLVVTLAVHRGL